jgi:hypothetical protein
MSVADILYVLNGASFYLTHEKAVLTQANYKSNLKGRLM